MNYSNEDLSWKKSVWVYSSLVGFDERLGRNGSRGGIQIVSTHGYKKDRYSSDISTVILNKENALKLAKAITEHYSEDTKIVEQSFYAEDTSE